MRNSSRLIKLPYSKVKYNGVSCPSIIPSILKYGNMEEKQLQSKHRWLLFTEPPLASCCYDWLTHLGRCSSLLEDIGWWVFTSFFFLYFCLPFANWVDYCKSFFILSMHCCSQCTHSVAFLRYFAYSTHGTLSVMLNIPRVALRQNIQ